MLIVMGKGDVSKEIYDTICELCRRYSQGSSRNKPEIRYIFGKDTKSSNGGVTCVEINTLLDYFRTILLAHYLCSWMSLELNKVVQARKDTPRILVSKC